jgi:hypothetical protein
MKVIVTRTKRKANTTNPFARTLRLTQESLENAHKRIDILERHLKRLDKLSHYGEPE